MAVTRIKRDQITDGEVVQAKIGTGEVTGAKLEDDITYNSNMIITGNLTVQGTTTTLSTTNTVIEDPLLYLSSTETGTPSADAGFIVERGTSTNVGFIWDESADEFAVIGDTAETGGTAGDVTITGYGDLRGNTIYAQTGFSGDGSSLTSLTAANISTGNLAQGVQTYIAGDSGNTAYKMVFIDSASAVSGNSNFIKDGGGDAEFTYNPSTNTLTVANVVGNADTADAWSTTRTITMSGDVSSDAVNIDGSGNVTITNTVVANDSHTHDMANLTGTTYAAGSGANLTSLTAANISTGSLADGVDHYMTASSTASAFKVALVDTTGDASGNFGINFDSGTGEFTYNPSTNTLTASNIAGTLTTAAQSNVTSLGTLTTLTVDNLTINGNTMQSDSGAFIIEGQAASEIAINEAGADVNTRIEASGEANAIFVEGSSGNVGFGTAAPSAGATVHINSTDSIILPVGLTGERPGSPATGMTRWNTSTGNIEVYSGSGWNALTQASDNRIDAGDSYIAITDAGTGSIEVNIDATTVATYDPYKWTLNGATVHTSVYNTTTNATPTELFVDGSSTRLSIASGKVWAFTALIAGRRTDVAGNTAGYKLEGVIENIGGTTTLGGSVKTIFNEDDTNWDVAVSADDANDALVFTVTGVAAHTISWRASVTYEEV